MGSFSFGEILTILVIILIIFGPNRLPEFARRVGELIAWSRKSIREFTESVEGELGDGMQPLSDLKREFDGARNDLTGAINSISAGTTPSARKPPAEPDDTEGSGAEAAGTETPVTEAPEAGAEDSSPPNEGRMDPLAVNDSDDLPADAEPVVPDESNPDNTA